MKFILPFISGIILTITVHAQDVHFSQVMNCPLNLNPALTGGFEGDWRFIGNYRNQWQSLGFPFRTIAASYDRQLYIKNHHLSVGGFIVNDHSGNVALNVNKIFLSGAYHRILNNHQLSGGLQIGYVLNKVGEGTYFDHNFNPATEDFDVENILDVLSYFDVNVGFNWKKKIRNFEPQLGFALYHINNPNVSFFDGDSRLSMRNSVYGGVKTKLSSNFYFTPQLIATSFRGANDIILGLESGYAMSGNTFNIREIRAGIFTRNTFSNMDAMVVTLGAQVRKLYFQVSYDYNVSSLNKITNSRGAFEITFIYKSISTIIKTFTIPCERI